MIDPSDILKVKDNFAELNQIDSVLIKKAQCKLLPYICVCVPTYKRVSTLKETIESILKQKGFDRFEIIISDNNPERDDETENYVNSLNDERITYYKSRKGLGMYGNMNRLIQLSNSQVTVIIHDDDLLLPYFLRNAFKIMTAKENIDVLFTDKVLWDSNSTSLKTLKLPVSKDSTYLRKLGLLDFYFCNQFPPTGVIFRTKKVLELGGYNTEVYPSNDYYFNIKAVLNSNVYFLDKPSFIYRWGVNASLKKETIIGFMKVDIPLQKWIANKGLLFKLLYPIVYVNYSNSMYNFLIKYYPESSKNEVKPYIFISEKKIYYILVSRALKILNYIFKLRNKCHSKEYNLI